MCHLVLLMPVIALPIFLFMPIGQALPFYLVIVAISAFLYWLMVKAMRRRVETGAECLIGAKAEVVSKLRPLDHAQYIVRSQGELWTANCSENLEPGETVSIASVNGVRLVIERRNNDSAAVTQNGAGVNAGHCH